MAITNTRTVESIEVVPAFNPSAGPDSNEGHPSVTVRYAHTFDDTEDAELPVTTTVHKNIVKYAMSDPSVDEVPVVTGLTDYSGEDPLVQSVCAAIWS